MNTPEAVKDAAIIEAVALLDVALAGTLFTKPDRGRIVVHRERAEKVLAQLRAALTQDQGHD